MRFPLQRSRFVGHLERGSQQQRRSARERMHRCASPCATMQGMPT